jgi:hypothetical protein
VRPKDVARVKAWPGSLAPIVERLAELDGVQTLRREDVFALFFFGAKYDRGALRSLT